MDLKNLNQIQFKNHEKCCRICINSLDASSKSVGITKIIEKRFKEILGIELLLSPEFSRKICTKCDSWLRVTFTTISKLKTIQEKLKNFIEKNPQKSSHPSEEVLVKCDPVVQNNIFTNFQPSLEVFDSFEFLSLNQSKNEILKSDNSNCDDFDVMDDFEDVEIKPKEIKRKFKENVESSKVKKVKKNHPEVDDEMKSEIKDKADGSKSEKIKYKRKKEIKAICQECGLMLSSRRALMDHIACIHEKIKRYFCDLCSYSATIKHHMSIHMKSHLSKESRRVHRCTHCDFVGLSKCSLRVHKTTEHSGIIYTCHCGKEFHHKNAMKLHSRRVHDGLRPYVCHCEKAFFLKKELREHQKILHEPLNKNFFCDFCGAGFCTGNQLKKHLTYHLVKLKCPFKGCDKVYPSKFRLNIHMKIHNGVRDKFCHLCEKAYFSTRDLKIHLDVFHKQTTYFCEFCTFTNSRKDYLSNHLKSAHNLNAEERSEVIKRVKFVKNDV